MDGDTMTSDQYQLITEWIDTHWKTQSCPWDGTSMWEIEDRFARVPAGRAIAHAQPVFPLVVLTCSNCGYAVFLNALKLGLETQRTTTSASVGQADD